MTATATATSFKRADAVLQGSKVNLERYRYVLRIKDAKFGPSKSSGNPMITVETEILGIRDENGEFKTEYVNAAGQRCKVSEIDVPYYLTLTDKSIDNVFTFFDRLGNPVEDINPENPDTEWMKGKYFEAVIFSEEQFIQGPDRKPILDANGQKVSNGFRPVAVINQIIGVCEAPQ